MDQVNILALDQASNCGWCTSSSYGVWNLKTKKDESSGMKMLRFKATLDKVCKDESINLICYERVAGRHANSLIHSAKMVAIIETYAEENNIQYRAYSATEIKKFATGKGTASKQDMINAATLKYNYVGSSDDEADAIFIYQKAKSDLNL